MEFYLFQAHIWASGRSFNSQRDGILRWSTSVLIVYLSLFQFPTGWNSTVSNLSYFSRNFWFQFPTGWNSTRVLSLSQMRKCVSIPNGMEFYIFAIIAECLILIVSIPNGMEFYITPFCFELVLHTVSIPNGMEFYAAYWAFHKWGSAFQFPTGWNSTVKSR